MSEAREERQHKTQQAFIDAQIQFCETILSLDQLLTTSKLPVIESADAAHRTKVVMNAIRIGGNDEAVKAWEDESHRAYRDATFIEDEKERETALAEWAENRKSGLANIIRNAMEGGHAIDAHVDLVVRQVNARPKPVDLIQQAILVTLVSAFESLIGKTYRIALEIKPELYLSGEREYSLAEIVKAGELEAIIDAAIEKKVDTALRGGLEDWEKIFLKLDVHFKKLCIDWNKTSEVFQRRNALIHTHGSVNNTYSNKVKGAPPLGTPLQLNEEYLQQAINQIAAIGNLVLLRTWLHLHPRQTFLSMGAPFLYLDNFLDRGYFAAVHKMADEMKGIKNDLDLKIRLRIYAWLARKNLQGLEAIKDELEEWDTSALKSEFAFSKAVLLDDFKGAEEWRNYAGSRSEPWASNVSEMPIIRFGMTGKSAGDR
ncbi:hypothetical protein ABZW47_25745 [Streptomyces sp. NPDC004549]|uniref:hypothetical protein n=1 Tax=Streptomyces sp. NPDC004549 TaxID=3154283 RepID=UPI0033A38248